MPPDTDPHRDRQELEEAREEAGPLVALILAPGLWALHFLIVYIAGAIACERAPWAIWQVRLGIAGATVAALVAIVLVSVPALREWSARRNVPTDRDSPKARSRFLASAALLLAALSAVAVVFQALPAALAGSCS